MYDIHCHIIPGVDDGADSINETMEMLSIAASGHTRGIVCTPHSNIPKSFQNHWDKKLEGLVEKIISEVKKRNLPIDIYKGQEIFLAGNFTELIKSKELITLNGSDYVLVEFSPFEKESSAYRKLAALTAEGYKPIVAHPERYAFVIEQEDAANNIKELGGFIQINKGSLKGRFGETVAHTAQRLLAHRLADFVASDAHSPYRRTPYLTDVHEMISTVYSADYADCLLKVNPLNAIENKKIFGF